MKVLVLGLFVFASHAQASPDASLVCKNRDKTVSVYQEGDKYRIEVDAGSGPTLISTDTRYLEDVQIYAGHVTEPKALDGFGLNGPLTLGNESLIVQDPYTGSATAVWDSLKCEKP